MTTFEIFLPAKDRVLAAAAVDGCARTTAAGHGADSAWGQMPAAAGRKCAGAPCPTCKVSDPTERRAPFKPGRRHDGMKKADDVAKAQSRISFSV